MAASRIDDLRRRVEADPASIAFAQLAEEYRRAGQSEEAVRVCRDGLTRHPAYLSARVTLGRALLDLGQFDEAREELEFVAREAPENLAAVRGLAEILHREGALRDALDYYKRALALARHDPELEEIVQQLSRQVGAEAAPSAGLSFEEAHLELLSAAERVPLVAPAAGPEAVAATEGATAPFDFDKLVSALGSPSGPPIAPPEALAGLETPILPDLGLTEDPLAAVSTSSDPFGALEAELRAREQAPPAAEVAIAASPEEPEEIAEAPEIAVASEGVVESVGEAAAEAGTVEAPPDEPATPPVEEPATVFASEDLAAPAGAEPPPVAPAEPLVEDLPAFAEMIEPSAAEPLPWIDPDADRTARPWPWEPVAVEEVATAEFFDLPESALGGPLSDAPQDEAVAAEPEMPETNQEHAAVDAGPAVLDVAEAPPVIDGQEPLMAPPETPEASATVLLAAEPTATEAAPVAEDDVLGDLEGWLETLQARSGQP